MAENQLATSPTVPSPTVPSPNEALSPGSTVPPVESPPPGMNVPSVSTRPSNESIADQHNFYFSSRTCLELLSLMSDEQIETEARHLCAMNISAESRLKDSSTTEDKRNMLHAQLARNLCHEVDSIVNNFEILLSNVSRSVKSARQRSENIVQQELVFVQQEPVFVQQEPEPVSLQQEPVISTPPQPTPPDTGITILQAPVRFLDIDLSEISLEEIEGGINFAENLPGGRQTAYFGSLPYSYGRVTHQSADYPELELFNKIFGALNTYDTNFCPNNYTCLVTKYPNGKSTIPMHSDNEDCILPGSEIITVSFGATRTLRFVNDLGAQQEHLHKLSHGLVHCMTSESQKTWRHGILYEPTVQECRFSFTFRRLVSPPLTTNSESLGPQVPPIRPPGSDNKNVQLKRILIITDSMHSDMPEYLFEQIPNHICVKKTLYQLSQIDGWAPQFEHADIVAVSCGINDLSRYGNTAHSLADIVASRFRHYSKRYPNTQFIFNSLLLSRDYPWLNREVRLFNKLVFEIAQNTRNFSFFDSDQLVAKSGLTNSQIYARNSRTFDLSDSRSMHDGKTDNGIHVSLQIRKMVTRELVNAVGSISGCRGDRFRSCEWLRCVTTRGPWIG